MIRGSRQVPAGLGKVREDAVMSYVLGLEWCKPLAGDAGVSWLELMIDFELQSRSYVCSMTPPCPTLPVLVSPSVRVALRGFS
eukprot:15430734-Alexandrium_andersonii.AAC.1